MADNPPALLVHEQIADLRQRNREARVGEPGQLCFFAFRGGKWGESRRQHPSL